MLHLVERGILQNIKSKKKMLTVQFIEAPSIIIITIMIIRFGIFRCNVSHETTSNIAPFAISFVGSICSQSLPLLQSLKTDHVHHERESLVPQ